MVKSNYWQKQLLPDVRGNILFLKALPNKKSYLSVNGVITRRPEFPRYS